MRKFLALFALLGCSGGGWVLAADLYRPVVEAPQEVYFEGYIDGVALTATPTLIVDSNKVYVTSSTVIKLYGNRGSLRDLRVGMKVSVYGVVAKGGVIARIISVDR